ncbi:MFS transporter [Methylobacterium sp. Leaf113]|uniref:MFS transporter n=1 Tax=Methylobacterium sp. Leaf113 TaxID=1736259 RepID=UPI000700FB93|nr:MFS transporter [Methylobacterium sp. Leaf113]KQP73693.1 MFS transporter [Methylobacterium sp. Leaf113]
MPEGPESERRFWLLLLVSTGAFMQAVDATIVNAAIPIIASALSTVPLELHPVLTAYVLTLAVCIPATPWLCERYGTKRIFGGAIVVFTAASLLCGLATSVSQLVAARVLQGIGGAALLPVGRYVMVRSIDPKRLVATISTVATVGLVGATIGPFAGGVLAQYISWRMVFFINVPIGIFALIVNNRHMIDVRAVAWKRFDTLGFALFGAGSVLLLDSSENVVASRWQGVTGLAGAIVLFAIYIAWSRHCRHPLVDLALFRVRSVAVAMAGNLLARLGISGLFLIQVIFLQVGCAWSPAEAGLMLVPQAIGSIVAKRLVDRLLVRYGYKPFLLVNTTLVALSVGGFAALSPSTGALVLTVYMFLYGCLTGLQYTVMNTLIYTDIREHDIAMASSMASTMQYFSMSFGIAIATLLMNAFLLDETPLGYVHAFRETVIILGIVTFLAGGIFATLPNRAAQP